MLDPKALDAAYDAHVASFQSSPIGTNNTRNDIRAGIAAYLAALPQTVTDEEVEAAAKAMCASNGYDLNEPMANDGPRWKYYVPMAQAALLAARAVRPAKTGKPVLEQFREGLAATRAALAETPKREVEVKPLEWKDEERGRGFPAYADSVFGRYTAWDFDGFHGHYCPPSSKAGIPANGDLTAAKAAAQADYEARIRSALALPDRAAIIEECAKVADQMRDKHGSPTGDAYSCGTWDQGVRIASSIRALK